MGINHFMWGYQPHFRVHQKCRSESIFKNLDKQFQPEVFIVGILVDDRQDRYTACVEPEEDFWIQSDEFNCVLELAAEIAKSRPESKILHSHPLAQQRNVDRLIKEGVQKAISDIIADCTNKPSGMSYYPSYPVKVEGYLVSLVIGLQQSVIEAYASLNIDKKHIHEYRSFKINVSLIDAVIDEYLLDVAYELSTPDPGIDPLSGKSTDEILRSAGNRFMERIALKVDSDFQHTSGSRIFFDTCNRISGLKYENVPGAGKFILARKEHPALIPKITFKESIKFANTRASRKALELSSNEYVLHTTPSDIIGLVEMGSYETENEDLYEINILGHHTWELAHDSQVLMHVETGVPTLPFSQLNKKKLLEDLPRIFKSINTDEVEMLISILVEAEKEKHGTMVVITEDAEDEAQRLSKQASAVEPFLLTPDLVKQLTPIDGAILISPNGNCYAIGVILDGFATEKGDSARGARFNSAIRYPSFSGFFKFFFRSRLQQRIWGVPIIYTCKCSP